uniref:hypothetical protein n=1 Tax=Arthrobacter silvisoli TaxID=2291022 RepID=UPI003F497205
MSVQAGIEVETDIAELVGEMPEVPCQHTDHGNDPDAHDGRASHYAQGRCVNPSCMRVAPVLPLCQKFIDFAMANDLFCRECFDVRPGVEVLRVLAPIKP